MASSLSDILSTIQNGVIALNNLAVKFRLRPSILTPEMFGADGTATNDTTGIQACIDSGEPYFLLQPRVYLLDARGLVGAADQVWFGCNGQTIIRQSVAPTLDMVLISSKNNVHIKDIIFDGNGMLTKVTGGTYPNFLPTVLFSQCTDCSILNCQAIGWYTAGFLANIVPNFQVSYNAVTRTTATGTFANYGIAVVGAVGFESTNVEIHKNITRECQISANVGYSRITENDVKGWGFSAGINMAEAASCHDNFIAYNSVRESLTVQDVDGYYMGGIENWSPRTVIEGNNIIAACGNGIDNGAADCTVSGNVCLNNGAGGAVGASGIFSLADLVTIPNSFASGSLYSGNRCTQGTGNQDYGYSEQAGAGLTNIIIDGSNNFQGNVISDFSLNGGTYTGVVAGTWVPVVTASTGAITAYTASGVYRLVQKTVYFSIIITITNAGTGADRVIATLPFSAAAAGSGSAAGLCSNVTKSVTGTIYDSATSISLLVTDGTFPTINFPVYVAGTYEMA